jgi:hypothetical protein
MNRASWVSTNTKLYGETFFCYLYKPIVSELVAKQFALAVQVVSEYAIKSTLREKLIAARQTLQKERKNLMEDTKKTEEECLKILVQKYSNPNNLNPLIYSDIKVSSQFKRSKDLCGLLFTDSDEDFFTLMDVINSMKFPETFLYELGRLDSKKIKILAEEVKLNSESKEMNKEMFTNMVSILGGSNYMDQILKLLEASFLNPLKKDMVKKENPIFVQEMKNRYNWWLRLAKENKLIALTEENANKLKALILKSSKTSIYNQDMMHLICNKDFKEMVLKVFKMFNQQTTDSTVSKYSFPFMY